MISRERLHYARETYDKRHCLTFQSADRNETKEGRGMSRRSLSQSRLCRCGWFFPGGGNARRRRGNPGNYRPTYCRPPASVIHNCECDGRTATLPTTSVGVSSNNNASASAATVEVA